FALNAGQLSWGMFDTCVFPGLAAANIDPQSNTAKCIFAIDNYVGLPGPDYNYLGSANQDNNGITMSGVLDSQVIGNMLEGIGGDAIPHMMINSVFGSGKCQRSWNFIRNKKFNDGGDHPDYMQFRQEYENNFINAYSDGQRRYDIGQEVGNIFVHAVGTHS